MLPAAGISQAEAGLLTLLKAENKAGHYGVALCQRAKTKPFKAQVRRGGTMVHLGLFATAEEAALCVARSPEGQAAAKRAAAAALLTNEEAQQQAEVEGLTLRKADNTAGYFGVNHRPGQPKPYAVQVRRGGKVVYLGHFATAEEAALCFARSPEGRAAAAPKAAAARLLTSEEAEVVEVLEAEEVEEEAVNVQMVEVVAVMEPEAVVDAGGRSKGRPKAKRRRNA